MLNAAAVIAPFIEVAKFIGAPRASGMRRGGGTQARHRRGGNEMAHPFNLTLWRGRTTASYANPRPVPPSLPRAANCNPVGTGTIAYGHTHAHPPANGAGGNARLRGM